MAGIRKGTQRTNAFSIVGAAPNKEIVLPQIDKEFPNIVRIQNMGVASLYVGTDPNMTTSGGYKIQIAGGGGVGTYVEPRGMNALYLYSSANANIVIDSYIADEIFSNDLYQTLATVIINSTTTSSVTLAAPIPAGSNTIGKVDIASALPAGTNNIGDVDILSLPALPAGSNTIGNVGVNSALHIPTAAPTIYNVALTNADTQYSQVISNAKRIQITIRDGDDAYNWRLAFVTGKVATPTEPYLKMSGVQSWSVENISVSSMTLYLACSEAGHTAEIEVW